jgi:hypothetical protein
MRARSMEPLVPESAWCVFAPGGTPDEGTVALVYHHGLADSDTGASYGLKRVGKISGRKRGGSTIRLEATDRRYRAIRIEARDLSELRVIGRLVDVLGKPAAS